MDLKNTNLHCTSHLQIDLLSQYAVQIVLQIDMLSWHNLQINLCQCQLKCKLICQLKCRSICQLKCRPSKCRSICQLKYRAVCQSKCRSICRVSTICQSKCRSIYRVSTKFQLNCRSICGAYQILFLILIPLHTEGVVEKPLTLGSITMAVDGYE